jgi:hypothetical protein
MAEDAVFDRGEWMLCRTGHVLFAVVERKMDCADSLCFV